MTAPGTGSALPSDVLPLAGDLRLERGADGRHRLSYSVEIPYFGWLWRPLLARRARRVEVAADAGAPLPAAMPWWAPPVPQQAEVTAGVAAICLLSLVASYAGGTGGLLTETLPYAAKVYHVGDDALGTGLALVRIGVVLALALGAVADRRGRRRFALALVVVHCVLGAAIGLAPTFATYIAAHVALRCIDSALAIVLTVLVVELVPAGNRAISVSLMLLAGGAGLALAVGVLPLAALGRGGFAAAYGLQLLALPLVLAASRRLPESPRFLAARARGRRGYRAVFARQHRSRLALIGAPGFLGAIFYAPTAEFFTRYLDRARGFSAVEIVIFLAVTGLPSAGMVVVGGRLADAYGRRRVAIPLLIASTLCLAGFFLTRSVWLWLFALAGETLGAAGAVALSVYGPELFPTNVRSAANTVLLVIAVAGSAVGLVTAGVLSGTLGIGGAIAALAIFPLLGLVIVALRFPETAGLELEVTSGEAAAAAALVRG
ncbi:MAG TPA: MFS transporter [Solirubrobacteraceae bacterium]|nr:MFS transporter [Solirubrobacteraceae bacterium]